MSLPGAQAQQFAWSGSFFQDLPCPAWIVDRDDWHIAHGNARGVAMGSGSSACPVAELDACFDFVGAGDASIARLVASAFGAGEEARMPARLHRSPDHRLMLVCWPLESGGETNAVALLALQDTDAPREGAQAGWRMRVGHDLRGPINPMRMAVQLLKGGRVPAAEQLEAVRLIDRQLDVLLDGIQDMSDLLRAETGALVLNSRPNDLNLVVDLVSGRSALLQVLADRRQQLHCAAGSAEIVADHDPARLCSLLEFLIRKASEHSSAGATLVLALDESESEARFAISGSTAAVLEDPDLAQVSQSSSHGEHTVKAELMRRIAAASGALLVLEREPLQLLLTLPKAK